MTFVYETLSLFFGNLYQRVPKRHHGCLALWWTGNLSRVSWDRLQQIPVTIHRTEQVWIMDGCTKEETNWPEGGAIISKFRLLLKPWVLKVIFQKKKINISDFLWYFMSCKRKQLYNHISIYSVFLKVTIRSRCNWTMTTMSFYSTTMDLK